MASDEQSKIDYTKAIVLALIVLGAVIIIGMCKGYSEIRLDDYKRKEQMNAESRRFLEASNRQSNTNQK